MIRENQLNIYDIPISQITEAYLDLIAKAQDIQFEVAGEYLVMAAMLVYIKSCTLLPLTSANFEGEEAENPKDHLVKRLLVYQEIQRAAGLLQERVLLGRDALTRDEDLSHFSTGLGSESSLIQEASPLELSATFLRLLKEFEKRLMQVEPDPINFRAFFESLANQLNLRAEHVYHFEGEEWTSERIILTLMVFLELSKQGTIAMIQEHNFMPICIRVLNASNLQLVKLTPTEGFQEFKESSQ
jgi:segregation and condensation protein A